MFKVYLSNEKSYSSNDTKFSELDNYPIEKIEYFLNKKEKLVFSGFEKYTILNDKMSIFGVNSPEVISMTILGKHKDKCYQVTQNIIWGVLCQQINIWGKEYTPMFFQWKAQKWIISSGQKLNRSIFHDGVKGTPKVRMVK